MSGVPHITATEASRNFSKILDRTEHEGETFVVERNGRTVAEIRPAPRKSARELLEFVADAFEADPEFREDMREIIADRENHIPRGRWPDDAE